MPTSQTKAYELKQLKAGRVPTSHGFTFVARPLPMARALGTIGRADAGAATVDDTAGIGELELLLRAAVGE